MRSQLRRPTVAILVSITVLVVIFVISHKEDTAPASPPSYNIAQGAHNFRLPNHVITDYDYDVAARLATLVKRRATAADPDLIRLIGDMLDPPNYHMLKVQPKSIICTPQCLEVDRILKQKRGGFYVESGAFDGERASNTLYLEKERGWTGLLVEMDPFFYTQLLGKSRRSWSINACLSPLPYVTQLQFKESFHQIGKLVMAQSRQSKHSLLVPCFPLHALLVALNQSVVDYFSLDVEGVELEVLRTMPFHQIDMSVLSVEYRHGHSGKHSYVSFMNQHGYDVHKDIRFRKGVVIVDDFIFRKKTLTYDNRTEVMSQL